MTSTELRIGNLILNRHNEIHIVNENTFQDFRYPRMDGNYGYSGIPLTEEWLLKFGFKQDSNLKNSLVKMGIWFNRTNMEATYLSSKLIKIEYVHQLQNLYWCLCWEELEWQQ